MKITRQEILDIEPGSSLVVKLENYNQCLTVKQQAYEALRTNPNPFIERMRVFIDSKNFKVRILAVPVNNKQS